MDTLYNNYKPSSRQGACLAFLSINHLPLDLQTILNRHLSIEVKKVMLRSLITMR